jgi:hypothetical protein
MPPNLGGCNGATTVVDVVVAATVGVAVVAVVPVVAAGVVAGPGVAPTDFDILYVFRQSALLVEDCLQAG